MTATWDDPSYGAMADDFDLLFDSADEISRLDAEALDRIFAGKDVGSVLDCACGTGIQAIGLASLGYQVEASDISIAMVDVVRRKAAERGLSIPARQQDFRNLTVERSRTFDAVVCYGGSITLLPDRADMDVALASMLAVVSPGGLLVVGLHDYGFLRNKGETFLLRRGYTSERGDVAFDARVFAPDRVQIVHTIMSFAGADWRVKSTTKCHHYLDGDELRSAMQTAGCESVELHGIDGSPLVGAAEWVIGVGRKSPIDAADHRSPGYGATLAQGDKA